MHGGSEAAVGDAETDGALQGDLVVISVSGVQQFISESRTTSDLSAGSGIIERLSKCAARECVRRGARLVFPVGLRMADGEVPDTAPESPSVEIGVSVVPNRIVALVAAGSGSEVAAAAADAVRQDWAALVRKVMHGLVPTPGMPSVQWVSVPAAGRGYGEQWAAAQRLLMGRKRLRSFDAIEESDGELCSLSPRWPAEAKPPKGVPAHERDRLAAANWVKRRYRYVAERVTEGDLGMPTGFPSTSAVASAPFRAAAAILFGEPAVSAAVSRLRDAARVLDRGREQPLAALQPAPGASADERWLAGSAGRWVYANAWQEDVVAREFPDVDIEIRATAVAKGARAVRELYAAMREQDVAPPAPYLAVIAQDLDGMGRFLGGEIAGSRQRRPVTEAWHRDVSERLSVLAQATCSLLETDAFFGVPVYAGGDDLLAFSPAVHALAAARACRGAVPDIILPTASTAVLFFHHRSPLQRAVAEVQHLLEAAKENVEGKNGLAVGYQRRSGVREQSIQAWAPTAGGRGPVEDFVEFLNGSSSGGSGEGGASRRSSLRLVQDCLRDEAELVSLPEDLFRAEMRRLVLRHGGTRSQADALVRLAAAETSRSESGSWRPRLAEPVKVAAFLRQECAGGGA